MTTTFMALPPRAVFRFAEIDKTVRWFTKRDGRTAAALGVAGVMTVPPTTKVVVMAGGSLSH